MNLTQPCEFNTCPTGSPGTGFNASDRENQASYSYGLQAHQCLSEAQLCQRLPVSARISAPDSGFKADFLSDRVDSARFGIQTLSPVFFGGPPDFVVSGPNVGSQCFVSLPGDSMLRYAP